MFRQISAIGEPLLVPFCTSFNTDISGTKRYQEMVNGVHFSVSCTFISMHKKFHFIATLTKKLTADVLQCLITSVIDKTAAT